MNTKITSAIAALGLLLTHIRLSADAPTGSPTAPASASVDSAISKVPKRSWYPFHGYLSSVDSSSQSVALQRKAGERRLKIVEGCELLRDGKPIQVADLKPGEYLSGKAQKNDSGEECILAAKASEEAPAPKAPRIRKTAATQAAK